jgi:hypothetical protein
MTRSKQNNLPKSYGSIYTFRLESKSDLSKLQLNLLEKKLWLQIKTKAITKKPIKDYNNFDFLGNGWEWSVFKKDEGTVLKIPVGIFPEVNEEKYLKNTEEAFAKILTYFPKKFVANTKFIRSNSLNIIEQEYINGKSDQIILNDEFDKKLLQNTNEFLGYAETMLNKEKWIPDFNIKKIADGFQFRVLYNKENMPKITDFTWYYDPFRLFHERTEKVVKEKKRGLILFRKFIASKIK